MADASTHNDGGLLHQLYDYITSKLADAPTKPAATSTEDTNTTAGRYLSDPKSFRDKQIQEAGG